MPEGHIFLVEKGGKDGAGVVFRSEHGNTLRLDWVIDGESRLVHDLSKKDFVHLQALGYLSKGEEWSLEVVYPRESGGKPDPRKEGSNNRMMRISQVLRMSTKSFVAQIDRSAITLAAYEKWYKRPPPPDGQALLARWRREAIDTPHRLALILLANRLTTHDDAIADERNELRSLISDLCLSAEDTVKRCLTPQRVRILRGLARSEYIEIAERYRRDHRPAPEPEPMP